MFERELIESGESVEASSEQESKRELDEATHEPGARAEKVGSVEKSETVETAFTELVGTDKKVSQTDPPEAAKETIKSSKKAEEGKDAAPIEKTPATSSPPESQGLEESDTASMAPQRLDKELPESKVAGKQRPEQDLGEGHDPTSDISGIMDDPFGLGKGLEDGGPGDVPHGGIDGIGSLEGPDGIGLGIGTPKDLDAGLESEMPRDTPGGPGYIHPTKGPMGQGMVMDGEEKSTKGQKGGTSGQDQGAKGGTKGGTKGQKGETEGQKQEAEKSKKQSDKNRRSLELRIFEAGNKLYDAEEKYQADPSDKNLRNLERAGNVLFDLKEFYFETTGQRIIESMKDMPRPDGDDGTIEPPKSEEDIKVPNEAIDPTMMAGGPHSSGIDHRKHQGVVSDPAEWQDPETPDGGIKTDRDIATDPPGEELGKETKGTEE